MSTNKEEIMGGIVLPVLNGDLNISTYDGLVISSEELNNSSNGFLGSKFHLTEGNHIRWNIARYLSFPENGFDIYIDRKKVNKKPIKLPVSQEEFLSRVNHGISNKIQIDELNKRFSAVQNNYLGKTVIDHILTLITLLNKNNAEHKYLIDMPVDETIERPLSLTINDLLLIASLDPYMARGLGLYYIHKRDDNKSLDPEFPLNEVSGLHSIIVVGDWGNMLYPPRIIPLSKSIIQEDNKTIAFRGGRIIALNKRISTIYNNESFSEKAIQISGDKNSIWKIELDTPVEQLSLFFTLEAKLLPDIAFKITSGFMVLSTTDLSYSITEIEKEDFMYRMDILKSDNSSDPIIYRKFSDIVFYDSPIILKLIGQIEVQDHYNQEVGQRFFIKEQEERDYGSKYSRIPETEISSLIFRQAAPFFDQNGDILKDSYDIVLRTKYYFHPDHPYTPIRFILGYTSPVKKLKNQILQVDEDMQVQPDLLHRPEPQTFLPYLIAYFPLSGDLENKKNGRLATSEKTPIYQNQIDGVGLRLIDSEVEYFDSKLTTTQGKFTISLKISLGVDLRNQTVISGKNSFDLTLRVTDQGFFQISVQGKQFITSKSIFRSLSRTGRDNLIWIILTYDGFRLTIKYRKILDERGTVFDFSLFEKSWYFSGVADNQYGYDVTFENSELTGNGIFGNYLRLGNKYFDGVIKDFSIWQEYLDFKDLRGYQSDLSLLENYQTQSALKYAMTDRIRTKSETENISVLHGKGVILGKEFSVQFWFKSNAKGVDAEFHEIISFGWHRIILSINLRNINQPYKIQLKVNSEIINIGELYLDYKYWNKFNISFYKNSNGNDEFKLWVNNEQVESTRPNKKNVLEDYSSIEVPHYDIGFNIGDEFTHILIWDEAMSPDEIDKKLGKVQYIHRQLPIGYHTYSILGVDLLGRISEWSEPVSISTHGDYEIDTPSSVFAKTIPLQTKVLSVDENEGEDDGKNKRKMFILDFNLKLKKEKVTLLAKHPCILQRKLSSGALKQRFEIDKAIALSRYKKIKCLEPLFNKMVPKVDDLLSIDIDFQHEIKWNWTGLQQVYNPTVRTFRIYKHEGARNQIKSRIVAVFSSKTDQKLKSYTLRIEKGKHLVSGNTSHFQLRFCRISGNNYRIKSIDFQRTVPRITVEDTTGSLPPVKEGQFFTFTIDQDFRTYENYNKTDDWSKITEEIAIDNYAIINAPVSELDYERNPNKWKKINDSLKQRQITWLPNKKVARLSLKNLPADVLTSFENPYPEGYVLGAVVARNKTEPDAPWQCFTMLWHEKEVGANSLLCYILLKEEPKTKKDEPELIDIKLYRGKTYHYVHLLEKLPKFDKTPSVNLSFGVTAVDSKNVESDVSTPADVVVVDKRIPPKPVGPKVETDGKADYYKQIKVTVYLKYKKDGKAFTKAELENNNLTYNVYRASFSAIATKDLESRRLFREQYAEFKNNPKGAFYDDYHFEHWLDVVKAREWRDPTTTNGIFKISTLNELFPEKKDAQKPHLNSKAWKKANVVWQNWSERFYGALNNEEREVIANRMGNESAFTLINNRPVRLKDHPHGYEDLVKGYFPDSFYYRLQTQTASLQISSEMSLVSNPVHPLLCRKPRKPELSKVIPGDRSITFFWNLNREPMLSHYLIYRGDSKEEVEDLRWWSKSIDPRIVGRVEDPRIKTMGNTIKIKTNDEIKKIIGVYRAGEFNYENGKGLDYIGSFNYWNLKQSVLEKDTANEEFTLLSHLKPIADYVAIVVIFENSKREVIVQDTVVEHPKLTVNNGTLRLPQFLEINEVLGIYKAEEFDFNATPITNQQLKNHYYLNNTRTETALWKKESSGDYLYNLFELESEQAVLVYLDNLSKTKVLSRQIMQINFKDDGLLGLKNYFYSFRAICLLGNTSYSSSSSKCIEIKPLALALLEKPTLQIERNNADDGDSIKITPLLDSYELFYKIQKRLDGNGFWEDLTNWSLFFGKPIEDFVKKNETVEYRLWVKEKPSNKRTQSDVFLSKNEPLRNV